MASELKLRIAEILRKTYFHGPDDYVLVTESAGTDGLHVLVISPALDDPDRSIEQDLVWSELVSQLKPEEWGRISLLVCRTPDEVMTI